MKRWKSWSRRRRVLISLALAFVLLIPLPLGALAVDFAATPDHWATYRDAWCDNLT